MRKGTIIFLSAGALTLLLLIGGFFIKSKFKPRYNWNTRFDKKRTQPYSVNLLYALLETKYGKDNFKQLNKKPFKQIDSKERNSIIFYIGHKTHYDSASIEWFKGFMDRGNKIAIASQNLPHQLLREIFEIEPPGFYANHLTQKSVTTSFNCQPEKEYSFYFRKRKDTVPKSWAYFADTTIHHYWRNYLFTPISSIENNKVNFIKVKHGQGGLYLFTTPIMLTNYYMTTEEGYEYANAFFSEFGTIDKFYWDNFSRMPEHRGGPGWNRNVLDNSNLFEFILSNTSLRWAWYLFLIGVLLFLLFFTKRRQAAIDILAPDKNTTIEYAKAVGQLHYKTGALPNLADQLMKLYYSEINNRYGILQNMEKETQIEQVALQSGLKKTDIEEIYSSYIKFKYNPNNEVGQLIQLHSNLEYFYKNRK